MPSLVPAIIDQSIILNLGSCKDLPLFVPEKDNKYLGIISENEKMGKVIVVANIDCLLVLDIKNSF